MQQDKSFDGGLSGKQKPSRLSDIVHSIDTNQDMSIGELADSLGERAFGALLFIFAVPNAIPMPPGTSAILGLPLLILTWQLMMGRQTLWLPDIIRKRRISRAMLERFVSKVTPIMAKLERVLKPRFGIVVTSNLAERLIGLVAFPLSLILFLPIPFGNIPPSLAIACLALGLAERDGLAVLVGYLFSAASVGILAAVSSALYAGAVAFFQTLFGV
ncbi:MAG: exopolysaccharide biosynthesis protein [Aestuariivirga sp.]|uniref:exopolysaccharide biosynthesis protein n=1 Tax=Aestuariivirga sp. TaxID=2650926 RepID=UPI0025C3F058|nr:exopolysaccharide biosynthesis protein [Aestuariivirga sp.]MCA3560561.1 exopolysaccharide biosynthesis protein [Aestuariivirga sp.]